MFSPLRFLQRKIFLFRLSSFFSLFVLVLLLLLFLVSLYVYVSSSFTFSDCCQKRVQPSGGCLTSFAPCYSCPSCCVAVDDDDDGHDDDDEGQSFSFILLLFTLLLHVFTFTFLGAFSLLVNFHFKVNPIHSILQITVISVLPLKKEFRLVTSAFARFPI